ncbi:hypothetical protein Tco_1416030, partial [Tanacetum coccineum]
NEKKLIQVLKIHTDDNVADLLTKTFDGPRYALINDPAIFDSLVKQFWSTATLRSLELGPPAILATIDETPYAITEDSVRSQLQLADDGGIDDLPIAEIYSGMDNLGVTRQYRVFKLSSKLFANMKLNFEGQPMQLLAAMLPQDQEGEGAGVAAQAVPPPIPEPIPEPMPEPDQPQDHLSTPPRQQTSDPIAPVFEHGQSSDPNIASFSRAHETDDEPFTSTNVEDEPLGGSFHASPPRSTQASPAGHTLGGTEDHITLSALSSVVSTLVQKVNSLETELKAHKKLFKDVVAKLVKKVKSLEVKLKTKKRNVVLSDSDQEERGEQAVDLDALIALANAAVSVDSNIPPGGASNNPAACSYDPTTDVPIDVPSGVAPTSPTDGPSTVSLGSTTVPTIRSIPAAEPIPARSGTTTAPPSSPANDARKGKGVAVEEPTLTHNKTFKQLEEERLGWEAAQRLQAQELVDLEKQRVESLMEDANLARQMSQDF